MNTRPGATDEDLVAVIVIYALVFMGSVGSAALFYDKVAQWLVAHQVIVVAAEHPIWALPGCAGAGLDWPRLAVVGGVLLVAVAISVARVRYAVLSRRAGL